MSGLVRLFESLDRQAMVEFVRSQIGALLDFDTAHGTELAGELERTLDAHHQRPLDPGVLASHLSLGAYRSAQVARALELIETDLEDPNERVAVHLALAPAREREVGGLAVRGVNVEHARLPTLAPPLPVCRPTWSNAVDVDIRQGAGCLASATSLRDLRLGAHDAPRSTFDAVCAQFGLAESKPSRTAGGTGSQPTDRRSPKPRQRCFRAR
jgi:hypothetical protein